MESWSTRKVRPIPQGPVRQRSHETPDRNIQLRQKLLQEWYTDLQIEVAQASQEPTNGTQPEGVAEDDNAGGM